MVEISIRQSIMARARPNYYNLHEQDKLDHDIYGDTLCFNTFIDHTNCSNQPTSIEPLHPKSSYVHPGEHDLTSTTPISCRTQETSHATETEGSEYLLGTMSKPEDGYETLPPAVRRKVRLIVAPIAKTAGQGSHAQWMCCMRAQIARMDCGKLWTTSNRYCKCIIAARDSTFQDRTTTLLDYRSKSSGAHYCMLFGLQ